MMDPTSQREYYTDPSLSAVHHALRASRRRLIVAIVSNRVGSSSRRVAGSDTESTATISVSQLARRIVAVEEDVAVDSATGSRYHSVYTTLIQTHLPKLDSLGVVEYQPDRKQIRPDQNFEAIAIVAAVTVPIAQWLFDETLSEHSLGGPDSSQGSTGN